MNEIIYVSGCSWTAGAELADHLHFSRHPGVVDTGSTYQMDHARKWFLTERDPQIAGFLAQDPQWLSKLETQEKSMAWPAELTRITGRDVINAAANGCGQEEALMAAREDILVLLRKGYSVRVIAQLTSPYRWMFPNLHTANRPWASVLVGNEYRPGSPEALAQRAFMAWPKRLAEIKWLNDIANLINFCTSKGIPIMMMQAWTWEFDPREHGILWDEIAPYIISAQTIDELFGHSQRNPGGHPTQRTHNELAAWLKEQLL